MTDTNPYKTYADDSILNATPLGLIVALYEGAIEASVIARKCLASGDIPERTRQINKVINIVSELMRCLNDEKGGEVSANLRRLYTYIQGRVIEAHTKKNPAPLKEVERLMSTMLEGWRVADTKFDPAATMLSAFGDRSVQVPAESRNDYGYHDLGVSYSTYLAEGNDHHSTASYSF